MTGLPFLSLSKATSSTAMVPKLWLFASWTFFTFFVNIIGWTGFQDNHPQSLLTKTCSHRKWSLIFQCPVMIHPATACRVPPFWEFVFYKPSMTCTLTSNCSFPSFITFKDFFHQRIWQAFHGLDRTVTIITITLQPSPGRFHIFFHLKTNWMIKWSAC